MIGIILFISSLISSISGGIVLYNTRAYVNIPNYLETIIFVIYLISFLLFILSVIFMRKNIKYLAIPGIIFLFISIILLIIVIVNDFEKTRYLGIIFICPSFVFFMYGFICDMKYHNNIFYVLIGGD